MTKVWEPCASLNGAKFLLASELWELELLECHNFTTPKPLNVRVMKCCESLIWGVHVGDPS
jgi:hypothetical protein